MGIHVPYLYFSLPSIPHYLPNDISQGFNDINFLCVSGFDTTCRWFPTFLENKEACEKNTSLLSSISFLSALAKVDIKFQNIKMQCFQNSYLAHDLFEERQTLSLKQQQQQQKAT